MQQFNTRMDAWNHFYEWIRQQPEWKALPDNERKRIYDAQADANGTRGKRLGPKRIKSLLDKYAPGRYEFREVVIFHE